MTRVTRGVAAQLASMEARTGRLRAASLAVGGLGAAAVLLVLLAVTATISPPPGGGGGRRVVAAPPPLTTPPPVTAPPATGGLAGAIGGLRLVTVTGPPSVVRVTTSAAPPAGTRPDREAPTGTPGPTSTTRPLVRGGVEVGPVQVCAELLPTRVTTGPCTT